MHNGGAPPYYEQRPSLVSEGRPSLSGFQARGREDLDATVNLGEERGSVTGLRDRLLREARSERQRCLEVAEAEAMSRTDLLRVSHVAVQTDPVMVLAAPSEDRVTAASSMRATGDAGIQTWSAADDQAQSEALAMVQMLGERTGRGRQSEGLAWQMEDQLRAERAQCQEREAQIAHERSRKEAAQQQVLCLEYELDGKEAALQVAEKALEHRDADLGQVQMQLRALQEGRAAGLDTGPLPIVESPQVSSLRAQLESAEQQLELKDQHIARLLNVLRQQRGDLPA